jgi:GntR family transcriptional regulator
MRFSIDPSSGIPIYLQIMRQIKTAIAMGRLSAEDPLPSVRQLAMDLAVNHNTIARAYLDLEHLGVIYKRAGQGTFVSRQSQDAVVQKNRSKLCGLLEKVVAEAERLDLDAEEIRSCLDQVLATQQTVGDSKKAGVDEGRRAPARKD